MRTHSQATALPRQRLNVPLALHPREHPYQPGPDDYVISSDEKTSIQARCRCHPTLAPGVARSMRVNHEYDRGGALGGLNL